VGLLKVGSGCVHDGLEFRLLNTFSNELVSVLVSSRDHAVYDLVHEGLGETGVIKLVMTHLSVSNHINDHVLVECLAVLSSEFESFSNVFHAVSVDVENRGVNALSNVGSVDTGSALVRSGGEADLIVNNYMNSASYVVVLQRLHLQGLLDHSLSGEGGVSVDLNWHHTVSVDLRSTEEMLLGASSSTDDRVDGLEMRRVGHDGNFDCLTRVSVSALQGCTEMVLDIT